MDISVLDAIDEYLEKDLPDHYEYATDERRYELLDFLERLMDLGEKADEVATKLLLKDSVLGVLAGMKTQQ